MHLPHVLALAVLPSLLVPLGDEEIKEARKLFGQPAESDSHQARRILVAENSPEAVEVLLENLGRLEGGPGGGFLHPAHYRDVAWDGLVEITDIYARRVVEECVKDRRAEPLVRRWCIRLVGVWGEESFGDSVERCLKDKDEGVQREAAHTLGLLRHAPAAKDLAKLARDKDPVLRANAIGALARIDAAEWQEVWRAGLADKDAGVRCALLGIALEVDPEHAGTLSLAALADEDWRPRAQAVENLAGVRTKLAVDGLIGALGDQRAAVRERAQASLVQLTGQQHRNPATWERWWGDQREAFTFPEGQAPRAAADPQATQATYYDIPVTSDRIAFVIDKSRSMGEPMGSRDGTKDEVARAELDALLTRIQAMEQGLVFNVHTYNDRVETLFPRGPEELAKKTHRKALDFVEGGNLTGYKDIWQVLEMVVSEPELDTIYLLSSGEPEVGLYVHWPRVTDYLRDLNRFHKVTVHTIAFTDSDWYREQMQRIAEATGGEYRAL